MNWYSNRATRLYQGDTRTHVRFDIGWLRVSLNFPHGQGWLHQVQLSPAWYGKCVRLSCGGYRLGNPFGISKYRGIIHLSVLDLTLTVIWRD